MDDRWDEVLDRLRDLDARLRRLEEPRDPDRERRDHDHRGGDFDEKRVIDTIVRLVTENVARELDRRDRRR